MNYFKAKKFMNADLLEEEYRRNRDLLMPFYDSWKGDIAVRERMGDSISQEEISTVYAWKQALCDKEEWALQQENVPQSILHLMKRANGIKQILGW